MYTFENNLAALTSTHDEKGCDGKLTPVHWYHSPLPQIGFTPADSMQKCYLYEHDTIVT
jgi:hypothetical protein